MGRAGGAVERLDDEIAWTIGGSPIGYHNAVVRCTASEGRSGFLVEEWRDALRQRSLPGSWHWTPGMHPHDLPRLLLDAGFEDGGDEPAMAAQLAALADMPMATELQVTPVEDSSALDAYRQVLAAGFGEGPKEADWVASVFAIIGLGPHSRWRHFVGTVAGRSCRHRLHPADRLDRRHLLRLHAARRPPAWLWCRDHVRSDVQRGAHRSHGRRPRLLADGAARVRAARIPKHLLHPALRAGRVARELAPSPEHLARGRVASPPGASDRLVDYTPGLSLRHSRRQRVADRP